MAASLEHRRLKILAGALPENLYRLNVLTESRVCVEQVDIVFPSSPTLLAAFSNLKTRYAKGKTKLSDLFARSSAFVKSGSLNSDMIWLGTSSGACDDTWCIDAYGQLTLCVSDRMYQQMGIPGAKLKFPSMHSDAAVVTVALHQIFTQPALLARVKAGLKILDAKREEEGLGEWKFVYPSAPLLEKLALHADIHEITPRTKEIHDCNVPTAQLSPFPGEKTDDDEREDWHHRMISLFEWVGLAALSSPRLSIHDRPDPYIAIYEPPEASLVGNATHLRWRGLLSPSFLKSILDVVLGTWLRSDDPANFIAITVQPSLQAPVGRLAKQPNSIPSNALRVPRSDGEDTWSLILSRSGEGLKEPECEWVLVECLGQGDARWG
ncbi:ribonuclease P 40kDa subunit-domain-containing protein [Schizophyllum commune]